MRYSTFKIALVLGLITAIGPLAIDMYLPALPSIGKALKAESHLVQLSLTLFAVGMGLGQIFFGSLSDLIGRKRPLYSGLLVFVVCSLGCALTDNIDVFLLLRLLAGFGASAGIVIARAVVRDIATGAEAAKLMTLTMLVFSVSPLFAPPVGNLLTEVYSWRAIFWTTCSLGVLGIVLVKGLLTETNPGGKITPKRVHSMMRSYRTLFRDPTFTTCLVATCAGITSFFTFITTSPFVFIEKFNFTPSQFSLFFPLVAASYIGATQVMGKVGAKVGLDKVLYLSAIAFATLSTTGALLTLSGDLPFAGQIAFLAMTFASLGFLIPSATILAMKPHGAIAGACSAAIGMMQFLCAGIFVSTLSTLPITPHQIMFIGIMLAGVVTCIVVVVNRRYLDTESSLFK